MSKGWKYLFAIIVAVAGFGKLHAQTDPQFTQFYRMPAFYNPAVPGNSDYLEFSGAARLQWLGIEGAPKDFYIGGGMPVVLGERHRLGAGLQVYQESIGLYRTLEASAQASYKFSLFKGLLSIGVQPGLINQNFRGTGIFIPDDSGNNAAGQDPDLPVEDLSGSSFDLGAGIWFSRAHWWVGFSASHIFEPSVKFHGVNQGSGQTVANFEFKTQRAFYLMAGGNIPIKNTLFEVNPSLLLKHSGNFNSAEATALIGWKKMFFIGAGYRWRDAVSLLLGAEIKGVYLGYSYDYPTGAVARASHGSHELVAGYRLKLNLDKKNKFKYKSIRLM